MMDDVIRWEQSWSYDSTVLIVEFVFSKLSLIQDDLGSDVVIVYGKGAAAGI